MEKVGIFYGSSTGNCQIVAELIKKEIGDNKADIYDVAYSESSQLANYTNLIFGVSTWGIGEIQDDWFDFFDTLDYSVIENKRIALFGLGDQLTYNHSFVDAMGIVYKKLVAKNCCIVGFWDNEGYNFHQSKALINGKFVGLALDEDTQNTLSLQRIKQWTKQLESEFF